MTLEEGVDPRSLQAPARELSPEEYQEIVDSAFMADKAIRQTITRTREDWWELAARFHDFHERQLWKPLGLEHLSDWLGQPEISYGRSTYDKLRTVWEQLVVLRGVNPDDIKDIDWSKAVIAVSAMKAGRVPLQQALTDARGMSRSDLIEEYVGKFQEKKPPSEPDPKPTTTDDEPVPASDVEPRYGHFDEEPEEEVAGVAMTEPEPHWVRCPACAALVSEGDFVPVGADELEAEGVE